MEFNLLNNLAIVILSFAGFIAGMILSKIKSIQEELKPGKKYFIKLKNLLTSLIGGVLFYYNQGLLSAIIITLILFFILTKLKINSIIHYVLFAIVMIYSTSNKELLVITMSMIFIAGLPLGTLQIIQDKKIITKKTIILGLIYLLSFIMLYAIKHFFLKLN